MWNDEFNWIDRILLGLIFGAVGYLIGLEIFL